MTTHYQTLELGEQASADAIRRAYRRLVLLTHPDRTPDPAAHQRYLAVNEAYEVLGDARRRAGYDALLWVQRHPPAPRPAASAQPAPTPAAARPTRARPPLRKATRADRYAAEYQQYAPYARRVCQFIVGFCGLLFLDFCFTTSVAERIQALDGSAVVPTASTRAWAWHAVETEHVTFRYLNQYGDSLFVGKQLLLRRTPFLGIVRSVDNPTRPLSPSLFEPATIYSSFLFMPVIMAGVATIGLLGGTSNRTRINAAICVAFLLPICIFLLFYR